jgi:hypothetical protein
LKSEKAMKPTTNITAMPCSMRRRTKAIKRGRGAASVGFRESAKL